CRTRVLPAATAGRLAALARERGATAFMALLAAFGALLHRYTGAGDLVVGTASAGRERVETEGLIGLFVNTLALRLGVEPGQGFAALLDSARDAALEAQAHRDLPFERLVEELRPERRLEAPPLFQVMLVFQSAPTAPLRLPGLELRLEEAATVAAKFDLTLDAEELPGGDLALALRYRSDLFDGATARRLLEHLCGLLAGAAADPGLPLAHLPLLTPAERHALVTEWNDAAAPAAAWACVHEAITAQARQRPTALAAVCEEGTLTYGELDRLSARLARRLRALGVRPEARVGIHLERSLDLLVAILGVLRAGSAYVPLDPEYPRERLAYMLADAGAAVLVTRAGRAGELAAPGVAEVWVDALSEEDGGDLAPLAGPEHLAYVLYTSGTTGRAKGVAIEHRQLAAYVRAVLERLALDAPASFALVSTFAADLGNTVLFPSLCTGGCLHVIPAERAADPAGMADWLGRHEIDCLKIVPSHLAALRSGPGTVLPRRRLVLGGEATPLALAAELCAELPPGGLLNHYGPTEATVGITTYRAGSSLFEPRCSSLPLGRPLAGTRIHLMDRAGELVPPGAPGEVRVGGTNVSRGYLGRPDLTAERFVPDPFGAPGDRLYRTGDLARRLPDGALHFLGRIDHQIKVRGFRVELGEVEAALRRLPGVKEAVVAVCGPGEGLSGDRRLVAYVVAAGGTASEWRAALLREFPEPMVPSSFVTLESLPLTPNGKVDRAALPAPPEEVATETGAAPAGPVEEILAGIWSGLLGRRPGRHDGFFEMGGHSLLATQLASR
ncbi:MAG TPA: amino acid adenylation domain-containing protein, partial [Thermoanaerobaculia bacterium]